MTVPCEPTGTRRQWLKGTAAACAALTLPAWTAPTWAADAAQDPYAGFRVGMQSYSLRNFSVEEALKHTHTLGLKYWEAYPRHLPMNNVPGTIASQKQLLDGSQITLVSYGVLPFSTNETQARSQFEFAKAMGIRSLSANPDKTKATFDLLDKLVEEYGVAIAIHNHGPGHAYHKISDALDMVKDRHPLLGACVDTGHYLRSDEDPVEAIERFGKRTFGVHLKDVKTITQAGKSQKQFKILGEGDLNIVGCLRALRKLDYDYCVALEYEENPQSPLSDIEACLRNLRDAVQKL